jgi:hypothetical protein
MNNFFDLIDKFKFGIVAAIAAYIGIFMYFQMESYTRYFPIEPFHDGAYVETPEDIELNPENIQLPPDYDGGDIKNMVSDMNDTRDKSYENYTQNNGGKATNIKELEAQMYKEAGGSAERERLKKLIEEQKQNNSNNSSTSNNTSNNNNGGNTAYAGKTMVSFNLANRTAYQNNNWYVRNPGYKCDRSSGTVAVDIIVNENGNVISASINYGGSGGANQCMKLSNTLTCQDLNTNQD